MEPRENESAAGTRTDDFRARAGTRCLRGARRRRSGRNRSKSNFE